LGNANQIKKKIPVMTIYGMWIEHEPEHCDFRSAAGPCSRAKADDTHLTTPGKQYYESFLQSLLNNKL
jgi:hypothetical protein